MKRNILYYVGLLISMGGLVALWQIFGIKAWIVGLIISFGSMLETIGYDEV